ncbi:MAG: hypothetical protein J6D47_04425 [Peptostreptococcaceae bacterium]|nr:hypothetical protein [Peptostreptococcaceae bacterium]
MGLVKFPQSLSDHPSLIGILRMPMGEVETSKMVIPYIEEKDGKFTQRGQEVQMAVAIYGQDKTSAVYSIPKNNITDFYPYTYYVLTDGEAEPLILEPQYMPSSVTVKGKFALSHQPVERYYIQGYKGDNEGRVYNITNLNQMMLPTGTNEGMQFLNANANTIAQTRKNQVTGNILNAINVVGSAIATGGMSLIGGGVTSVISGINSIKETDARNKDTLLTPTTISSFGTPSTRQAFNTDSVRLIRYTVKDSVKNKVNNFVARYGNKYNNYAEIDLKKYKGYVKFISPDIDSSIDNIYINKIISILERGVFIE